MSIVRWYRAGEDAIPKGSLLLAVKTSVRIDGNELLAFRIEWELLVGTPLAELSETLSTQQFQEDILRERDWILRDVKLGVDSNSIIIIRTCVSICLGT